MKTTPGEWISVRVTPGVQAARMAIGDQPARPAYIENVRGRRRGVETWAKLRCPDLRPGRYTVRVTAGDGVVETAIRVV